MTRYPRKLKTIVGPIARKPIVKTRRVCAGEYETTNTVPMARISKSMDGDGTWNVSWGDYDGGHSGYFGIWGNKKDCLYLIESVSEDFTPESHDSYIKVN